MSTMLGSDSRLVPSLLAVASGLTAAAVVGATSYLLFGAGSIGGPPQSPRAAALRYAHLLHASDIRNLDIVVCDGIRSQPVSQAWPLVGVAWRLEPGQLDAQATSFRFDTTDGVRHLQVQTRQARTGWCVSAVAPS
jgi:hypothetical protein